jgi:hypothetical protein
MKLLVMQFPTRRSNSYIYIYIYIYSGLSSFCLLLSAVVFCCLLSESESDLLYDWQFTANHLVLATSPFRLTTRIFTFQLNTCGYSPYITSSLTRI